MSLMRSEYKELGVQIIKPMKDDPCYISQPHMVEEKKDEGVGDYWKRHIRLSTMSNKPPRRHWSIDYPSQTDRPSHSNRPS